MNGPGGMKLAVSSLPEIAVALIGEPTGMQPAIAEKGLMVLDFTVHGKSAHAAHNTGINALYRAVDIIDKLRSSNLRNSRTCWACQIDCYHNRCRYPTQCYTRYLHFYGRYPQQ